MYIVLIGWLYVALMMAVAEATNANGTVLGGTITLVLYGLAPVTLVLYLMGTPARRKAIRAREAGTAAATQAGAAVPGGHMDAAGALECVSGSVQPDAGCHPAAAAQPGMVAPVRKVA